MKLKRCWINQPSSFQVNHNLHGVCVLAEISENPFVTIYFLNGPVVSQTIDRLALVDGWKTSSLVFEK